MQNEGSNGTCTRAGDHSGNLPQPDLEKQGNIPVLLQEERQPGSVGDSAYEVNPTLLTIVVTKGESHVTQQPIVKLSKDVDSIKEELPCVASSKKGYFLRTPSSHEQCRYIILLHLLPVIHPASLFMCLFYFMFPIFDCFWIA